MQRNARQQVLSALAEGRILKPIDLLGFAGRWGCLPIPEGGQLIACEDRDVRALATDGWIARVPDVGYVLAREPPSAVSSDLEQVREAARRHPVKPYSFADLLDGKGGPADLSTVFHLHVPKAGGRTVHKLLRQNNFTTLDFDMNKQSFFGTVIEEIWTNNLLMAAPRRFALSGHYRLDVAMLRAVWVPHAVITTLRDPIKRVLSHYNFSLAVKGNPYFEELRSGQMSFLEYAEWLMAPNSIGPQYSFFDDTGAGSFARTGTASPGKCFDNLLNKVGLFGFTDLFDEFSILFGYLMRCPNIATAAENETAGLNADAVELKKALTQDENKIIGQLYGDDIWFFEQAKKEYRRRTSDPRIQAVIREAALSLRNAVKVLEEIKNITDPADPRRPAFNYD